LSPDYLRAGDLPNDARPPLRGFLMSHSASALRNISKERRSNLTLNTGGSARAASSCVSTTTRTKAKGRILLRDLALSVPIFRDPVLVPDHNACYPGIAWHPRAEPVFLPHSSMIPLAARAYLPPPVSSCPDRVSLPILEDDC
jgi:hypothetical protein